MVIRIVQLICPAGHAQIAAAYESRKGDAMKGVAFELVSELAKYTRLGGSERCAMCGSLEIGVDDIATQFQSLREATEHLQTAIGVQRAVYELTERPPAA